MRSAKPGARHPEAGCRGKREDRRYLELRAHQKPGKNTPTRTSVRSRLLIKSWPLRPMGLPLGSIGAVLVICRFTDCPSLAGCASPPRVHVWQR